MSLTNTEVLLKYLYCDKEEIALLLVSCHSLHYKYTGRILYLMFQLPGTLSWHELGKLIIDLVRLTDEELKSRVIRRYRLAWLVECTPRTHMTKTCDKRQ